MPATTVRWESPSDTVSFRSFFDLGTVSAAMTSATRKSSFPNSSIVIAAEVAAADATAASVGLSSRALSSTDRKSTRLNSSHDQISYAVFCLKKKKLQDRHPLDASVL